jgi:hypothetical protein
MLYPPGCDRARRVRRQGNSTEACQYDDPIAEGPDRQCPVERHRQSNIHSVATRRSAQVPGCSGFSARVIPESAPGSFRNRCPDRAGIRTRAVVRRSRSPRPIAANRGGAEPRMRGGQRGRGGRGGRLGGSAEIDPRLHYGARAHRVTLAGPARVADVSVEGCCRHQTSTPPTNLASNAS